MGGVIIYSFLIAGGICLIAVSLFMWLNAKDSSVDDKAYNDNFHPGALVSKYKVNTRSDEDDFDKKSLNRYAQKQKEKKAPQTKLEHDEELEADKAENKPQAKKQEPKAQAAQKSSDPVKAESSK